MKKLQIGILILLMSISCLVLGSNAYGKEDLSNKMLVRIDINNIDDITKLQEIGLFSVVEESNYVDGLIDKSKDEEIKKLGYSFKEINGDDLVQRIIEISINDKKDVNELAALGLDIWEVKDENIIAMAFDNDIHSIKKKGYKVKILYKSGKEYIGDITTKQKNAKEATKSSRPLITQESTPEYHSYESLKSDLETLQNNYPDITKLKVIGKSWEDRNILALKISDDVNTDDLSEPDVLFMGNHHAREWISVEVPFYIAKYIVEHYSTDLEVKQLVNDNEIWVIPMLNPDGLEYSRIDDSTRLWRKNRREGTLGNGVDLNRNYAWHWGEIPFPSSWFPSNAGTSAPFQDTYWGPDAFSEPETRAIRDLILSPNHTFTKSISYHSYGQYIAYPWGYDLNPPPHELQLNTLAKNMEIKIENVNNIDYLTTQSSRWPLYITYGGSEDWLYNEKNMASFTVELRPCGRGISSDCLTDNSGTILPIDQIIPTYEENLPAALYLMKWSQQLDIISPISSSPVKVADITKPIEVIVEVKDTNGPMAGYTNNDFAIWIGGLDVDHILEDTSIPGRYKFKVYPPIELFPRTWKIEVKVKCAGCESKDLEESAVQYPDQFGYTYRDSNNLGICGLESGVCDWDYDWTEISGTGTEVLPDSDDEWVENIDLGFFFNYYGTDYSQLAISNNGLLFSGVGTWQYVNQPIGQTPDIHGFIAPYWDDLITYDSKGAGTVYYKTLPNPDDTSKKMFVVEWYDNKHYSTSDSGITFEAILYEGSNNIKFQYKDVDFGNVYNAVGGDNPPYNNGGSATVGIESPVAVPQLISAQSMSAISPGEEDGLQYSFNEAVINPELAILFKFPQYAGANLFLSKKAPISKDHGSIITYSLYYHNLGDTTAQDVVLEDTLPAEVEYISASDSGSYDSNTRKVTWDIGSVVKSSNGLRTVTVRILESAIIGTVIQNNARISTSNLEVRIDDNEAQALTEVTGTNLPQDVGVEPNNGGTGTLSVYYGTPTTFSYNSCSAATGVDIRIHINDGGSDITGSMNGGPSSWTYTTRFYPRTGQATITYTIHGCAQEPVSFNIYIDPAGYIYDIDIDTNARISGATVWLQRPDGSGEWENVPEGALPNPIMQPDDNPLTTGIDGQYQWDVLAGTYRVHVEAPDYYPADSNMVVIIDEPVTDLHVGLTHLPDTTSPVITNISNTSATNSAVITWDTNEASDSLVKYGTSSGSYTLSENSSNMVLSHSISLTGLASDTLYYYVVNSTDGSQNHAQSTERTFRTQAPPDTTPPVIESITLYPVNATAGAKINVTVQASDNVGVIEVKADGVSLIYSNGEWNHGSITAPSTIGSYIVTVMANDSAGNSAVRTASYKVVKPSGGLGVGISPMNTTAVAPVSMIYNVRIKSTENIDDIIALNVSMDGLSPGNQIPLSWFNWTEKKIELPAGGEKIIPLTLNIPAGTSGKKIFRVKANSTLWTPKAQGSAIIAIS